MNAKDRAHQTRSTLPGLFLGPSPAVSSCGPCLGSFTLRVGFLSVDSTHFLGAEQKGQPRAWLCLGCQAMPTRPLGPEDGEPGTSGPLGFKAALTGQGAQEGGYQTFQEDPCPQAPHLEQGASFHPDPQRGPERAHC